MCTTLHAAVGYTAFLCCPASASGARPLRLQKSLNPYRPPMLKCPILQYITGKLLVATTATAHSSRYTYFINVKILGVFQKS